MATDIPPVSDETAIPYLTPLATFTPPSNTRAWQSSPHPTLPILATATSDKSVLIYSLTSFRLLNRISGGHKRSVRSVGWRRPLTKASTTSVLVTGSFDSTVGIWRKDDESPSESHPQDPESSGNGTEIEINDRPSRTPRDNDEDEDEAWAFAVLLTGHDSEVKSVAFSPSNPSLLATSSRDKSVWIWEEVSGAADEDEYETIAVLTEHSGDVKCVAWNHGEDVLASGSYDDTIRLWREVEEEGDWMCVGCIEGHEGTVWSVQWEHPQWHLPHPLSPSSPAADEYTSYADSRGPRLISASDDLTIRVWRRQFRAGERQHQHQPLLKNKIPSIIKPASTTETWIQESVLPPAHLRSIYSLAWSERSGLIASSGGDGAVYVYREELVPNDTSDPVPNTTDAAAAAATTPTTTMDVDIDTDHHHPRTTWRIIAQFESAHGPYEVNHVCWALRRDRDRRSDEEEVLITTGDGGDVRVWVLPEGVAS